MNPSEVLNTLFQDRQHFSRKKSQIISELELGPTTSNPKNIAEEYFAALGELQQEQDSECLDRAEMLLSGLEETQVLCGMVSALKGFWDVPKSVPEAVALIHSEVSEALEAHRKGLESDHLPGVPGLEEELADTIIRCFDLAMRQGLYSLPHTILAKLAFNAGRPEKHGKAY